MELTEQERICILNRMSDEQLRAFIALLVERETHAAKVLVEKLPLVSREPRDPIRN